MTETPSSRLLAAILDEPQPCGHIERFVAFMVGQSVRIISGEDDGIAPGIDCGICEVTLSFGEFSRLLMAAMQERN